MLEVEQSRFVKTLRVITEVNHQRSTEVRKKCNVLNIISLFDGTKRLQQSPE
jgi:hypothetical protein